MSELSFSGERFLATLDSSAISYEHWHRYLLASRFVAGKTVLDAASGEGYGSAWLARTAKRVVGVDISPEAVAFAAEHYPLPNLEFRQGPVASLPLPDTMQFDVIVSFETIEHLPEPEHAQFLQEVKQRLAPGGLFICSTPNKHHYSDLPGYHNEFHIKEYQTAEFRDFLGRFFPRVRMLGQRVFPVSYLWDLDRPEADNACQEERLQLTAQGFRPTTEAKPDVYNIAVCSEAEIVISNSLLVDLSDQAMRERDRQLQTMAAALNRVQQESRATEEKYRQLLSARDGYIKELLAAVRKLDTHIQSLEGRTPSAAPRRPVSIIIPVFNKWEYTRQCLETLAQNTPGELFELVVVDNASTDRTPELLASLEGDIKILTNRENQGFVAACNQGAAAAAGEFLLFLNNDTAPQPGWLTALLEAMQSDPAAGAVGAKLLFPDGRLQEAGGLIFSDGAGWNFGRKDDPQKPRYNQPCEVDYCSGACLLVRRDLFLQLGGFDTRYAPAYYEDVDLCFGVRRLGRKVLYCPEAQVVHFEGATAGTDVNAGFKKYQQINHDKFVLKWARELTGQDANPSASGRLPATASRARLQQKKPQPRDAVRDRINLLVIDPLLPMYDRAAGSQRLFNLLKLFLAQNCRITYIARNGIRQESYKRELEEMGILVYATDPEKMAAAGQPVEAPRINLEAILQERHYHLAWLSFYEIAEQYLPEIRRHSPATRILIDTVDLHFLRESRQAELHRDPALAKKAKTTQARELAIYRQADGLIAVTGAEKTCLESHVPDKPVAVVPLIHDTVRDTPGWSARQGLVFVANFNHPPNPDAMKYFCAEVLPLVKRQLPEIALTIVGANPPEAVRALEGPGVTVTGYVLETHPYLDRARMAVAPLRFGAGMKGKIGEALSRGLPVVTTSIGAEGMGLLDGEHLLIADKAEAMAAAIVRLYSDQTLWQRIAENGRQYMETHYSSSAVAERVRPLLAAGLVPEASLVILTHNQLAYTRKCVESIFRCTDHPYELIFVDNASTDKTLAYLRELADCRPAACASVTIIPNEKNLGFAAGNNQGMAAARGGAIVLLNNDVVVTPGWLDRLLACARQNPMFGMVGPVSNYVTGLQRLNPVPYDQETLEGLEAYAQKIATEFRGQSLPCWRVVGFCMLITRAVVDKIGGLDPRFGMGNFEDDDFSLRAMKSGFVSRIARDCFVHHFGNRTFQAACPDYQQVLKTNWEIFKQKWGLPGQLALGADMDLGPTLGKGFVPSDFIALK